MEILELDINSLRPDPNQPRKDFNEDRVEELAQSIKTTGIINPVEADKNKVIVTGEYRWRAAKLAGLKTVPVKIINLSPQERYMRQIIENVQHTEMTPWDTGTALKKLLNRVPGTKFNGGRGKEEGVSLLAKKIGKTELFVRERLYLVEKASEPIKRAVRKGGLPVTHVRSIMSAPEKYKKALEKKIVSGEFKTRDASLHVAAALRRAADNPKAVKQILDTDYSKYGTSQQVGEVVAKMSPRVSDLIALSFEPVEQLAKIVDMLENWLDNNPKESAGKFHLGRVAINLASAKESIDLWLKGK